METIPDWLANAIVKAGGEVPEIVPKQEQEGDTENTSDTQLPKNKWYKGMPSPNPGGRPSKKPITDAILACTSPEELAELVVSNARKGKEWALKLATSYIQTPETLNRLAGESDGEPIRLEQLINQAKELGLDTGEIMLEAQRILDGEK